MNEKDLLGLWSTARMHIIVSQIAPTFLLTVTVTLITLSGGFSGSVAAKIATASVLLASGILGFLAQYSAANEALAVADDLRALENPSAVTMRIIASARWASVVKFVTPAIFVVIYLAIVWALFVQPFSIYDTIS
jgi:hypothetical protein